MPVPPVPFDFSGRPIINLGVMISSADKAAQPQGADYSPYPVRALVDTGAGRSQIDINALSSFRIGQIDEIEVYTASTGISPQTMPLFLIDLFMGFSSDLLVPNLEVIGSEKLGGLEVEMLLGRDVLNQCLLAYDGPNRQFSLAYDRPTPG